MHIALLAPLPPAQSGIADYAQIFMQHLQQQQVEVSTPLLGVQHAELEQRMSAIDWSGFSSVHAELGGGLTLEFAALQWLMQHAPSVKLTATVHDPERLVWRLHRLPKGLNWIASLPSVCMKLVTLLVDPLTLRAERQLAQHMSRLITLTHTGAAALQQRMRLTAQQVVVIAHGNAVLEQQRLPVLLPVRLLYFGFIYRGKGIENLLHALAQVFRQRPELKSRLRLTLAGGTQPNMTFNPQGNYCNELQKLAEELELTDNLDWMLNLAKDAIAQTIQAHHVMVLPYQESRRLALLGHIRGTSGALAWANACARGVITSDARAFSEEVSHGNGTLYPQGNTEALATCLKQLAQEPELCQHWSQSAAVLGEERAWPRTASLFINVFKSL